MNTYSNRQKKVSSLLAGEDISLLVLCDREGMRNPSIRYLTGQPSDSVLFIFADGRTILLPWDINLAKMKATATCTKPYNDYGRTLGQALAKVLAEELVKRGFHIVSGGTDNHSMLVDLRTKYPDLTGKVAENALVAADITVNKNMVPFDSRSAFQTSGLRLGTPAITTRGAKEDLMVLIAELIEEVLNDPENEQVIAKVRAKVNETMANYPLFAY